MPDNRRHRGPHPQDSLLFDPKNLDRLHEAVTEMSWLLERGYASKAGLVLVGDHHQLHERQRLCVMRASVGETAVRQRLKQQIVAEEVRGRTLHLDGYNVLITVESALAGGVVLLGRDGCLRDIAAMHGTFRKVEETVPALELCGQVLDELGVGEAVWYFDSPVSNSGRLKTVLQELATERGWPWRAEVVLNPDAVLKTMTEPIATADGIILDAGVRWLNLGQHIVEKYVPERRPLDFRASEANLKGGGSEK